MSTVRLSYAQLTAVLGAFSLVTVLSHITGAEIRGWLAGLIHSWNEVIRPPTAWVLRQVLTVPLQGIFGVTVVCPLWIRDYLSTGAVMFLSMAGGSILQTAFEGLRRDIRHELRYSYSRWSKARAVIRVTVAKAAGDLVVFGVGIVFWPLLLLALIVLMSTSDDVNDEPILSRALPPARERRRILFRSVAPLGYFLIFALVNVVTD